MNEEILVIKANYLQDYIGSEPGLKKADEEVLFHIIMKKGLFKDRAQVESDPDYKQIIPYIAMINDDNQILTLKRLETQSEKRLHNKLSLGVGGHVNNNDSNAPLEAFRRGMQREIDEEVKVDLKDSPQFLGVIYDNSTSVGKVHLGMAYKVKINFFGINERDKFEYSWKRPEELKRHMGTMENWSKFILDEL